MSPGVSLTNRGRKWEIINSLWVIAAALPLAGGLAWIWAGVSARRKIWTTLGVILASFYPFIIALFFLYDSLPFHPSWFENRQTYELFSNFNMLSLMPVYIVLQAGSLVYALFIRKKYLIYRDVALGKLPTRKDEKRYSILGEYGQKWKDSLYEDRGVAWAWRNSLVTIPAFLPFVNFLTYILMAIGARRKRWYMIGFLHMLLIYIFVSISSNLEYLRWEYLGFPSSWNPFIQNVLAVCILACVFVTALQAMRLRVEYLIRRDVVLKIIPLTNADKYRHIRKQANEQNSNNQKRELDAQSAVLPVFLTGVTQASMDTENAADTGTGIKTATAPEIDTVVPETSPIPEQSADITPDNDEIPKLDLNRCTEQQLVSLPGVGVAAAKKAIALRKEKGGFSSINDFTASMGLKAHFTKQIEEMCFVSSSDIPKSGGRVIDI